MSLSKVLWQLIAGQPQQRGALKSVQLMWQQRVLLFHTSRDVVQQRQKSNCVTNQILPRVAQALRQ
jgi:hypothetical protein